MHYRPASHRRGVTLLEVLTAIFIMAIGMLALLTLFPAGALSMARAVRDDRAASIAATASSVAAAVGLHNDSLVESAMTAPSDRSGPGNPVFIDPHYVVISAGNVGVGSPAGGIPRVAPNLVRYPTQATPPHRQPARLSLLRLPGRDRVQPAG